MDDENELTCKCYGYVFAEGRSRRARTVHGFNTAAGRTWEVERARMNNTHCGMNANQREQIN